MEAVERFLKYGEKSGGELPRAQYLLSWILPIATLVSIVLALFQVISGFWPAAGIAAQLALSMLGYGQAMNVLEPLFPCITASALIRGSSANWSRRNLRVPI